MSYTAISGWFAGDPAAAAAAAGVRAKHVGAYWIFDYDQIKADWDNPLTWVCRGLVTDEAGAVVCSCMRKFFNLGEARAEPLDWAAAVVYDKLDGTMLNRWWHAGEWRHSTRFNLGAGLDMAVNGDTAMTWRTLIDLCLAGVAGLLATQPRDETWTLEVCSPHNRVVVPYDQPGAWLVSRRRTATGEELGVSDAAAQFPGCVVAARAVGAVDAAGARTAAAALPGTQCEGVVVFDGARRAKVKNEQYVRLHYLKAECTPRGLARAWLAGETSEVLAYFPDMVKRMAAMDTAVAAAQAQADALLAEHGGKSRRDLAAVVKGVPDAALRSFVFKGGGSFAGHLRTLTEVAAVRWLSAHVADE
jgi:hypothetical protein